MAESTWTTRDLQVLEAVRAIEQRRRNGATADEVADEAGRDRDEVLDALRDLVEGGYVDGRDAGDKVDDDWLVLRLTADGRRAVGQWPSQDPAETLLRLLEERIAQATDPEVRTRLERLRDSARTVSTSVLSALLTDLVRGTLSV